MTPKRQYKAKFARLLCIVALPAVLVVLAGAYLVGEYGLPFGSRLSNNQRQVETAYSQKKWAERIELPGLPNLHRVSDDLYRGAQPTAEGIRQLKKLGVKTVINLRGLHSDRNEMKGAGLSYEHIRMTTWNVEDVDVIRFLKIATDGSRTPAFVHCQHGADRTGTMCAIYRIVVEGWSKDEAIQEMTKGGFCYHSTWRNLTNYIRNMDAEEIKNRSGLNE